MGDRRWKMGGVATRCTKGTEKTMGTVAVDYDTVVARRAPLLCRIKVASNGGTPVAREIEVWGDWWLKV